MQMDTGVVVDEEGANDRAMWKALLYPCGHACIHPLRTYREYEEKSCCPICLRKQPKGGKKDGQGKEQEKAKEKQGQRN